jgi:U6 snRNA-associated Sm-like protein LSm8
MAATGVSFRTDTRTLTSMVDARVSVITNDGRHIGGVLRGFDQVVNVILEDCHERVYSTTSGVEHAPLGLYMIRGDNMCVLCSCVRRSCVRRSCVRRRVRRRAARIIRYHRAVVGALDEDLDAEIDFTGVVAAPLRPIKF